MILVVDMGYLLFYRLHATNAWMSFQEQYKNKEPSQEELLACFEKHLVSQMDKLKKKYKCPMVFCKDARHAEVWRKVLNSEYKATRGEATSVIHEAKSVLMRILPNYGVIFAGDSLEADDVAYLTVKEVRRWNANERIVVITSDRDYLQMVWDDEIILMDAKGKAIKGSGNAEQDKLMKILAGDPSDNIQPICKGCGKKTAEALAKDPVALQEYLDKHQCKEAFEKNKLMICMDQIPKELVNAFYDRHGEEIRNLVQMN